MFDSDAEADTTTPDENSTAENEEKKSKKANREIKTVDQLVDKLIKSVFRDGICEAVQTLKQKPQKRSNYRTIMEVGLLTIIALLAAMFRYSDWVTKLMFPLHQVISIDDPLLTTTNYDRIVLAYLPLKDNGELTREFNVYKLAAMRCKADDDGGKSVKLHLLLSESGNLIVLFTTPVYQQQTSANLENLRLMARSYTICDFVSSPVASYSNWANELSFQHKQSCNSNELETTSCCNYIQHQKLCKSRPTGYLKLIGSSTKCSLLSQVHRSGKLTEHCCQEKTLRLSSKQQMHCLFRSSYEHQTFDQKTVNLKSHGLACKTNRTVNFIAMDKRFAGYFMKTWNLNLTEKSDVDHLAIISTYDDAVFSTPIEGGIEFMDEFLAAYSNGSLIPNVFDETVRGSFFNQVPEEVVSTDDHDDELCEIERLTAADFRSIILNDTNRVFSAVVFFSGGSGHGPSMAVNYILQTVKREFAAFDSLVRFFIIDVSRNSLPWAYVFDSLPSLMFFPAIPFPQTQSSLFPRELPFTIPNLMAFVLARAQPELRFRVALRACSSACLTVNRQRVHQFESAVRSNLRTLWLSKRRYTHAKGSKQIDFLLRRRRLQLNAARYLQNVLRMLQTHRSDGNSHVGFVNTIADVLIDSGHEVVSYMPSLDNHFGDSLHHKRSRVITRESDFMEKTKDLRMRRMEQDAWDDEATAFALMENLSNLGDVYRIHCEHQLNDTKLLDQLREENFDIAMTEFFDVCGVLLINRIEIKKYIVLYSSILPSVHGAKYGIPTLASFVPEFHPPHAPPYNFYERLLNQLQYYISYISIGWRFVDKVAGVLPEVDVDKYLQAFNKSELGVIYISFGSVAYLHSSPDHIKYAFLEIFSMFSNITFLVKYEEPNEPLFKKYTNVIVDKWMPQRLILAQKSKLLAFLSHAGMNSISEATYSGVPLIVVPLFADQPRNAEMIRHKKVGVVIEKGNFSAISLNDAIRSVVYDPMYKENAQKLAKLIQAQPLSPEEQLIKYTELAAEFDLHETFSLPGHNLSTFVFYNLDVHFLIFFLPIGLIYIVCYLCCKCYYLRKLKKD
ncbi:UDP-glucuronosyltransferase [Aphelenchoides besseyi]|nr:UDP-glucuronosyltransferase [Aphelenchoides besseyi]KAI6193698.1 UDP-glucuronosyltransferase [Aphelenchoides besseyi]